MTYLNYIRFKGFDQAVYALPGPVQQRFATFLRLACSDPDDKSVTDLCRRGTDFPQALAYPLGRGYLIYWDVERNIAGRPLRIQLLGFGQIPGTV